MSLTNGGAYQNNGTISATTYGVLATGGAASVTNNGQITAGQDGVSLNKGGAVSNAGSIFGTHLGVYIGNGVGVVQNTGTISAKSGDAVSLYAGGTLANAQSGQLVGGYSGVYAGGNGSTVTNAGRINGQIFGVYLAGSSTVVNSGTIQGGADGVFTAKPGAIIENQGIISGVQYGIVAKAGTQIINSGQITGQTGIQAQTGTTIENTGLLGSTTIGGPAVSFVGGASMLVLGTGAQVNGVIAGDNTASAIEFTGTGQYFGSITGLQAGSLSVQPGAVWAGDGVWNVGSVVNAGTLTVGQVGTPLTIQGDYTQTPTGTMRVLITPEGMSQLSVTGHAQLAGTLDYIAAPGTYIPKTYSFLSAAGGVSGSFTTITPANGTQAVVVSSPITAVQNLTVIPNSKPLDPPPPPPPSPPTPPSPPPSGVTASTTPAPQPVNSSTSTALGEESGSATQQPMSMSSLLPTAMVVRQTVIVAPQDGSLFPNSTQAQALAGISVAQNLMQHRASGGWVQATGNDWSADGTYKSRGGGFLAGFGHAFGIGRIGLAAGYDSSSFTDETQSKARLRAVRFGAYGDVPLDSVTLSAAVMDGVTTTRTTRVTGAGAAVADGHGNVLTAALQAGMPLTWAQIQINPAVGAMVVRAQNGAMDETSDNAPMAIRTQAAARTSVAPYLQLTVSKELMTYQGITLAPVMHVGMFVNNRYFAPDTQVFAADGTTFTEAPHRLSRVSVPLGVGLTMSRGHWQAMLGYNANIAGNWHQQALQGTVLVRF